MSSRYLLPRRVLLQHAGDDAGERLLAHRRQLFGRDDRLGGRLVRVQVCGGDDGGAGAHGDAAVLFGGAGNDRRREGEAGGGRIRVRLQLQEERSEKGAWEVVESFVRCEQSWMSKIWVQIRLSHDAM